MFFRQRHFFFYPPSLLKITANSDLSAGVTQYVEKLHFLATYVLAVAIYARQVFYSDEMMDFINDGIRIYFRCEPVVSDDVGVRGFMFPYIFRAVYSYFGYASMNYFSFAFLYRNASNINAFSKLLFFIPDFVITYCSIRFHSTVLMLTISFRRLNMAFKKCIDNVNYPQARVHLNLPNCSRDDCDQFDAIVELHQELFRMCKEMEAQLSNTILFTITNGFMNLTSTVSERIIRSK